MNGAGNIAAETDPARVRDQGEFPIEDPAEPFADGTEFPSSLRRRADAAIPPLDGRIRIDRIGFDFEDPQPQPALEDIGIEEAERVAAAEGSRGAGGTRAESA